jgi:hypothetical protein
MKHFLLVLISALLCGCVTPEPAKPRATITRAQVEQFIVKGKTTKWDVIREFGRPDTTALMTSAIPGVPPQLLPFWILTYPQVKILVDGRAIVVGYIFPETR